MNELITVNMNDDGEVVVSGRDLHEGLEVKTQYTKWLERMLEYGFIEGTDFIAISQKRLTAQGNETTYTDHVLKLAIGYYKKQNLRFRYIEKEK